MVDIVSTNSLNSCIPHTKSPWSITKDSKAIITEEAVVAEVAEAIKAAEVAEGAIKINNSSSMRILNQTSLPMSAKVQPLEMHQLNITEEHQLNNITTGEMEAASGIIEVDSGEIEAASGEEEAVVTEVTTEEVQVVQVGEDIKAAIRIKALNNKFNLNNQVFHTGSNSNKIRILQRACKMSHNQ